MNNKMYFMFIICNHGNICICPCFNIYCPQAYYKLHSAPKCHNVHNTFHIAHAVQISAY